MNPDILALDFDGVICDGRREYFQSGWLTYCHIWQHKSIIPPDGLRDRYIRLAPVIEIDIDVPLLVRALILDYSDQDILSNWRGIIPQILEKDKLSKEIINTEFARLRDEWINRDFEEWMSYQPFYPGVRQRLQEFLSCPFKLVIITNRLQRFALKLLEAEGITLPAEQVFGKQGDRPKYEVIRHLLADGEPNIWFVEDHVRALYLIEKQPDLVNVSLFIADWGFNTPAVRQEIRSSDSRVQIISFSQFMQDFPAWV
ncbi:haloacid dehalogenase [Aphanothece hegewaldii CCALA 016]|uniref:Haloacid dehalogenase n=1 Tax=Aphanothece hegewaldii CCALA 016 TaxID=2107694 RepID=A0A2T1LW10_9CHRO|nr:HAD family hydrolase [Aphanothece hegewaldii]PSF36034.1 haloacid dehalogenase [Aphanothece hegewaldii CCALA 016]